MHENCLQVFQHAFSLLRYIPFEKSIRLRVQSDLRGEQKSIRSCGLRIRTDWLRGMARYYYLFMVHGVVPQRGWSERIILLEHYFFPAGANASYST